MSLVAYDSDDDDNVTAESVPQKKTSVKVAQLPQVKEKKRIVVDFKNSGADLNVDSEEEEEEQRKKRKLDQKPAGGGLFSILPSPRNSNSISAVSVANVNQKEEKKTEVVNMMPYSLQSKLKNKQNEKNQGAKKSTAEQFSSKEKEEEDENDGSESFFTFNFAKPKAETKTPALPLPSASLAPDVSITKLQAPGKQTKETHNPVNYDSNSETNPYYNQDSYAGYYQQGYDGSSYGQPNYADYSHTHQEPQLDEEILRKLEPKRGKKTGPIQIQEVDTNQLLGIKKGEQFIPKYEVTAGSSSKASKGISGAAGRKHQITWLVQRANDMEQELKEKNSQSRLTKKQTQAKYGF